MDIALYAVGASGRVNLGDFLKDTKFVTVNEYVQEDGSKDGTLLITPVRVIPATGKRATDEDDEDAQG